MARFNVSAIGAVEADCALGSAAGFGAEVSCASTSRQKLINVATPTTVRSSRIFRLLGYHSKHLQPHALYFTRTAAIPPAAGSPPDWPADIRRTSPSNTTPQTQSLRSGWTPALANFPAKKTAPQRARRSPAKSQSPLHRR